MYETYFEGFGHMAWGSGMFGLTRMFLRLLSCLKTVFGGISEGLSYEREAWRILHPSPSLRIWCFWTWGQCGRWWWVQLPDLVHVLVGEGGLDWALLIWLVTRCPIPHSFVKTKSKANSFQLLSIVLSDYSFRRCKSGIRNFIPYRIMDKMNGMRKQS